MPGKKIVVLGTGGTIAGTSVLAGDDMDYTAAQIGVRQLVDAIPALAALGDRLVVEQVAQVDSKDMDSAVWHHLVARCMHWLADESVGGIVITHGTDTLEETAFLLHTLLASDKPVVLTCAMRPATALMPDGPQNLTDAFAVIAWPGACGVMVVCAGGIHGALDVQKEQPYRLDAFTSGDAGAIGYVEAGQVRLVRAWPQAAEGLHERAAQAFLHAGGQLARVEIVTSHAGADGTLVDALLVLLGSAAPQCGIVVACTGNGTIHHRLEAALLRAQAQGVRVVRSTRCSQGRVLPVAGAVFGDSNGLSPVKARIALALELMQRSL
ncbi:MAG TPA: asparaginase [Burkholderiaceae bacterium]